MIDFTKPIETVSGEPATYLSNLAYKEGHRIQIGDRFRHYDDYGKHHYGLEPDIRNVVEVVPPFDWTAKNIVDTKGRKVVSYVTTGEVTRVTYDTGKTDTFWTANADVWKPGTVNVGKSNYLTVVVEPFENTTDAELAAALRKGDEATMLVLAELIKRGYVVEDVNGNVQEVSLALGSIYKIETNKVEL